MNIGLLGHVDAGKTTLARALSTLGSTAAFDKGARAANLRANTIDLGFSAVDLGDGRRMALVDCPGHAQLIKAVLAAGSVFDGAIVVVSAVRGVEPQTVEHLILASILCPQNVIIVVSKVDLVDQTRVDALVRGLPKALKSLKIAASTQIIPLNLSDPSTSGTGTLLEALRQLPIPNRPISTSQAGFSMAVDHCFPLKGQGTVMTGTVLSGTCRVGSEIEIPDLGETRRVREVQSWKEKVEEVKTADRAALLFSNIPQTDKIDRTVIAAPGVLSRASDLLVPMTRIAQFKGTLSSRAKVHVSIGFVTALAECWFVSGAAENAEFEECDSTSLDESATHALLSLQKPLFVRPGDICLAAKLDSQKPTECRFVFYGPVEPLQSIGDVRRFRRKEKKGIVDRVESPISVICSGLFHKNSDISVFSGMEVTIGEGENSENPVAAVIEGAFGKGGKIRLRITTSGAAVVAEKDIVTLRLKKYIGHSGGGVVQDTGVKIK